MRVRKTTKVKVAIPTPTKKNPDKTRLETREKEEFLEGKEAYGEVLKELKNGGIEKQIKNIQCLLAAISTNYFEPLKDELDFHFFTETHYDHSVKDWNIEKVEFLPNI